MLAVIHRCPNIYEELAFTLALLVDSPPEVWFAFITGDDELVDAYLDDLD